jgi:hypothetical protein
MRGTHHAVPTSLPELACWNRKRNDYREIGSGDICGDALQGASILLVPLAGKANGDLAYRQ